jgi:enoyl-CoA hydratase/carnithine racemase
MWKLIPPLVEQLGSDDGVRVIVVRGAGDQAFVSGADISEFTELRMGEDSAEYDADNGLAFTALSESRKPVIALIHGFCIGGGVAISVCADLRYAADDALFAVPAARLGLAYPLTGARALYGALGDAHAKELVFTGRRFDANEALRLGLINQVFPKAELDVRVREIALGVAENAPLTLTAFKLSAHAQRDDAEAREAIAACYDSADYREGVKAFLEKRKPRFTGH